TPQCRHPAERGDPPTRRVGTRPRSGLGRRVDGRRAGRLDCMTIRVAVVGARGRMGRQVCAAVTGAEDLELVAELDAANHAADHSGVVEAIAELAGRADVAVDFTVPSVTEANVHALIDAGIAPVVGTTGWTAEALDRVRDRLEGTGLGAVIAPNFALSAVLAMRFAAMAAPYFES